MQLIKTAATRAQQLLSAAYGADSTYADYDYIINFMAIRNDDIASRFQSLGLNFNTQVVVLLNVPANTTDLSSYMAAGQPLENLVIPDSTDGSSPLEWRIAGQNDLEWVGVPWLGKIVDTNTAGPSSAVAADVAVVESFEWRNGTVYLSPCNIAVDLRLRGQFVPSVADNDAASFIRGMMNVLVYWACETIGKYGPGTESNAYKGFKEDSISAERDFVACLSKAQISIPLRLGGRRTQFPLGVGGSGFFPPVV